MTTLWPGCARVFAARPKPQRRPSPTPVPPPLALRWTEHAVTQLAALAEFISLDSPFYAEQVVDRIVARFEQARRYPGSGRMVPEFGREDVRELIESPYRLVYRVRQDAVEVLSILHGRQPVGDMPLGSASRPTG
jgi:toxin ParE1/3/4